LRERDRSIYGNPDGPTFEILVQKLRQRGLSDEEAWEAIIESSKRPNDAFNKLLGL
jgi:hypothetical protein